MEYAVDEEVLVCKLHVATGDKVTAEQAVCDLEYAKTVFTILSPTSGFIRFLVRPMQCVKVKQTIALIYDDSIFPDSIGTVESSGEIKSSVLSLKAQKKIEQIGLPPTSYEHLDYVRLRDVKEGLDNPAENDKAVFNRLIPRDKQQETINLSRGQNVLTSNFTIKVQTSSNLRELSTKAFAGLRSLITPIVLKHTCNLLKSYMPLNGYIDDNQFISRPKTEIGYAIDLDKGLRLLNLGDVGECSFAEISERILTGVRRYLTNTLSINDLKPASFSVTDLSGEQIATFTPLIGVSMTAALGICPIDHLDGRFALSLTFDHRATEGRTASRFLAQIKDNIEKDLRSWHTRGTP